MSLDAFVYCDCFEKGLLRIPPDAVWNIHLGESGARLGPGSDDLDECIAFDQWNADACEHEDGVLLHHYLGHIANIGVIRHALTQHAAERFPSILSKIVYNGSHCGDFIAADQLQRIDPELNALQSVHSEDATWEWIIRNFEQQLRDLLETAMRVRKPIVF